MFRWVVNTSATATHTAGHGDCEGDARSGACCCCCSLRGVPLGFAVCAGKGIAGAAVTVGFACGGGDDFDNFFHSASRSACVASLNAGFPSDASEKVPTRVQNRSGLSVTLGRSRCQLSPNTAVATV